MPFRNPLFFSSISEFEMEKMEPEIKLTFLRLIWLWCDWFSVGIVLPAGAFKATVETGFYRNANAYHHTHPGSYFNFVCLEIEKQRISQPFFSHKSQSRLYSFMLFIILNGQSNGSQTKSCLAPKSERITQFHFHIHFTQLRYIIRLRKWLYKTFSGKTIGISKGGLNVVYHIH